MKHIIISKIALISSIILVFVSIYYFYTTFTFYEHPKCKIELSEDKMADYQNDPHIDALMELTKKMLPIIKIEDDRDAMQFNCNMETPEKELTARELLQMRIDGQLSSLELEQGMKFLQDKFEMEELSEVMEAIREHQDNV